MTFTIYHLDNPGASPQFHLNIFEYRTVNTLVFKPVYRYGDLPIIQTARYDTLNVTRLIQFIRQFSSTDNTTYTQQELGKTLQNYLREILNCVKLTFPYNSLQLLEEWSSVMMKKTKRDKHLYNLYIILSAHERMLVTTIIKNET